MDSSMKELVEEAFAAYNPKPRLDPDQGQAVAQPLVKMLIEKGGIAAGVAFLEQVERTYGVLYKPMAEPTSDDADYPETGFSVFTALLQVLVDREDVEGARGIVMARAGKHFENAEWGHVVLAQMFRRPEHTAFAIDRLLAMDSTSGCKASGLVTLSTTLGSQEAYAALLKLANDFEQRRDESTPHIYLELVRATPKVELDLWHKVAKTISFVTFDLIREIAVKEFARELVRHVGHEEARNIIASLPRDQMRRSLFAEVAAVRERKVR